MLVESFIGTKDTKKEEVWLRVQNGTHFLLLDQVTEKTKGRPVMQLLNALEADPEWAEEIAAAGTDLVRRVLSPDNVKR